MQAGYPTDYEVGDVVFTCIGHPLFRQISAASLCWSNHVGIIVGHDGSDYIVAESRVPLSSTTTLSRFIERSVDRRYGIRRLSGGLSEDQKRPSSSRCLPVCGSSITLALNMTPHGSFAQSLCLISIGTR